MKNDKKFLKDNNGITLIALVVTIIVLIILAGVSINLLLGQYGVITKAKDSKQGTEIAKTIETARLDILGVQANNAGNITESQLDEIFVKYDKDGEIKTNEDDEEYIVTEEGYEIKVSDIYNGTTSGGETGEVSALEIFDSNGKNEDDEGYDSNKLHIGDFVNYDAGTWTEEEIKEIKVGIIGSEVTANNSTTLPSTDFQFGGFTAGTSRNGNATPYYSSYNYVQENGEAVTGWRVFDVADDGSMTLISAGCPEDYYSPYDVSFSYVSEYILTGNINSSSTISGIDTACTKRDWSKYVNSNQKATSATVLTKANLDEWYSKYMGITNANTYYSKATFQSVYGTKYESLIDNYSEYWLSSAVNKFFKWVVSPRSQEVSYADGDEAYGVRVLVTLSPEVKLSKTSVGTKTITSRNADYTYNIWDLR